MLLTCPTILILSAIYYWFSVCDIAETVPLADKIIFKSVDQILKLLPKSQLKSFPNDGIEYFEVQLILEKLHFLILEHLEVFT